MSYTKQELFTLLEHMGSHLVFWLGSVLLIYLAFCVVFFVLSVFCSASLDCSFLMSLSVFFNVFSEGCCLRC